MKYDEIYLASALLDIFNVNADHDVLSLNYQFQLTYLN